MVIIYAFGIILYLLCLIVTKVSRNLFHKLYNLNATNCIGSIYYQSHYCLPLPWFPTLTTCCQTLHWANWTQTTHCLVVHACVHSWFPMDNWSFHLAVSHARKLLRNSIKKPGSKWKHWCKHCTCKACCKSRQIQSSSLWEREPKVATAPESNKVSLQSCTYSAVLLSQGLLQKPPVLLGLVQWTQAIIVLLTKYS